LGDAKFFSPDDPVNTRDALKWIFRTRSVEPFEWDHTRIETSLAEEEDVEPLAEEYGIVIDDFDATLTEEELFALMQDVDDALAAEVHEASLYSEKFHGKGTAFGESFDMHALTAAHRSYPYNTLVRVTNHSNGKSVTVRINDRGPFVTGRDMDLSLAAFTAIEDRSSGKLEATFQRLGDVSIVGACAGDLTRRRISSDVILDPGVPHAMASGGTVTLASPKPFVLRAVIYPDGFASRVERWVVGDEKYELQLWEEGQYTFVLQTADGMKKRTLPMRVTGECRK
jgi:hypothetical protein